MKRRTSLKLLLAAPFAAGFSFKSSDVRKASDVLRASSAGGEAYAPVFFTAHEYETVKTLADLILPADERSVSATEAGVPDFIDFMVSDNPDMQTPMRGGLSWIDMQSRKRFGVFFYEAAEAQQKALLDDIAYPEVAAPEMSHGVAFFNSFRDLTASGFWSSQVGVEDLQYMGNTFVHEWTGCPPEALRKLGVSYDDG